MASRISMPRMANSRSRSRSNLSGCKDAFRRVRRAWSLNGRVRTDKICWTIGSAHGWVNRSGESLRWSDVMDYDVLEAKYLDRHIVWLRFRDGTAGEIDLAPTLVGPIFEALHDVQFFR